MQKIPTLYIRDKDNPKLVTREVDSDCLWVIEGEGVATEKWDGSACLVKFDRLFRRHRVKNGKAMPPGWLHWSMDATLRSGHGWAPVGDSTADQYHREAWDRTAHGMLDFPHEPILADGTYELVGPSLQKNPYNLHAHHLWLHGGEPHSNAPTGFDYLWEWFKDMHPMEGLVWHHPDGRMAKIKRRDFGLHWPVMGRKGSR